MNTNGVMASQLTLGQDCEWWVNDNALYDVPSEFRQDCSVPIEFEVMPSTCPEQLLTNTKNRLKDLINITWEDFKSAPRVERYNLGGHIHLGGIGLARDVRSLERRFLDLVLAVPYGASIERRLLRQRLLGAHYGLLCQDEGYHRQREYKPYGFEYRTLGGFPSQDCARSFFHLAKIAQMMLFKKSETINEVVALGLVTRDYYEVNQENLRELAVKVLDLLLKALKNECLYIGQQKSVGVLNALKNRIKARLVWGDMSGVLGWGLELPKFDYDSICASAPFPVSVVSDAKHVSLIVKKLVRAGLVVVVPVEDRVHYVSGSGSVPSHFEGSKVSVLLGGAREQRGRESFFVSNNNRMVSKIFRLLGVNYPVQYGVFGFCHTFLSMSFRYRLQRIANRNFKNDVMVKALMACIAGEYQAQSQRYSEWLINHR